MENLEYFDAVLPTLLVVNWHENMVQLVIFGCKFGENWYFFDHEKRSIRGILVVTLLIIIPSWGPSFLFMTKVEINNHHEKKTKSKRVRLSKSSLI